MSCRHRLYHVIEALVPMFTGFRTHRTNFGGPPP